MAKNIANQLDKYTEAAPITETMNAQKTNIHYVPARADKRVVNVINKNGNTTKDEAYDELKKAVIKKMDNKRSLTNKVIKSQVKRAQKIKEGEEALVQAIAEHIEEMDNAYEGR